MKDFVVMGLFVLMALNGLSQTSAVIKGTIVDSTSKLGIDYASITLTDIKTGKTITGAVSNSKGNFNLSNLQAGLFRLTIEFVGYLKFVRDSINITSNDQVVSVGSISLSPAAQQLQGVTVTAGAPIVENKIDKIVYNAANDITSQGGVALDVLKKVPQVTIDIDGNVELQGNNNIRFLINGKPSSMFGSSLADALSSIPASQIKSIEAITSPGAKYDAQGTGGIINIILKDSKVKGINGTVNLSAGTRLENGSVNLNFRRDKLGINAFFNGNGQFRSVTLSSQDRTNLDAAGKPLTRLRQENNTRFARHGYQAGVGFDYSISKADELTGNISYNRFINNNDGTTAQYELTSDTSGMIADQVFTDRVSTTRFRMHSYDWALVYKHKFRRDGQELAITYDASDGSPFSQYSQLQNYSGANEPFGGRSSTNPGRDREMEIAIDYSHPFSESFLLETGVKTIYQDINSDAIVGLYDPVSQKFNADPKQSYALGYKMNVYGGYISTTFSPVDWINIKAGARYEYSHPRIDFPNTAIPSYGNLAPSLIISHDFKNNESIKFAFSYRIERPEYRQLNPFLNISDPYNISTGNPLLKPEIGNNFELGYSKTFAAGGNMYVSLIERINTHDVKTITTFYSGYLVGDSVYNNVSVSDIQNIGTEYNSGISISGSIPIRKKLNLRSNIQFGHRYMETKLKAGNADMGVRLRLNLNASYQLPQNLIVEAFGNYNSATNNIQGRIPQSLTYTIAGRKQFLNKKASVGFTATNPFNKYVRQLTTIKTENSFSTAIRRIPFRSFGISVFYKFGKLEFRKDKQEDNGDGHTLPTFGG